MLLLEIRCENQSPLFEEAQKSMVADIVPLHPVVRTFQTCFDSSGLIAEWSINSKGRLGRLCHAYDNLQSRWCKALRYRREKAGTRNSRENAQSSRWVIHKKIVAWLGKNYQLILPPSFGTKGVVRRLNRKITGKSHVDLGTLQIQTETPF